MKLAGIDISRWQGDFDLAQAKAEGFDFVIIKGGGSDGGRYVDSKFATNYQKAKNLDIPVGVYWYTDAKTVSDAVEDAKYFYEHCLCGRQFELPVYLDVEGNMLKLGRDLLTGIIHAWCQCLESEEFWVGIYSSTYAFRDNMHDDELQRYAHWVAQWSNKCSYSKSSLGMWQYGGEVNTIRSNKVAGVVCDQNYMLVDYPAKIKARGKNGFGAAPQPEPEPEPEPEQHQPTPVAPSSEHMVLMYSKAADGDVQLTPNFKVYEFACQDGSDPVFIHPKVPEWCQAARDRFGYSFSPNSAYRTVSHNAKPSVGGAARSNHIYGLAVDIPAKGDTTPQMLYDFFDELLGDSGELGIYSWGVHVGVSATKKRFKG